MTMSSSKKTVLSEQVGGAKHIPYFLVSVVIGILLVPYFVSNLGIAAYGIIPLATSITGYVAIAIQSLNTVVSSTSGLI
ncbi:Uncharacterised protein [uncultured archaeon]|nr:Uncharacterised protein [uncultured archaeon]